MASNKFRSWLAETHGSQFELVRHFFSEQLVNDFISSDQTRRFAITVLAVLACVGPFIVRLYVPKYRYLQGLDTGSLYLEAVRADRLFFIALSMTVAGLVTVFQWHSLFPDLRDYFALKPLPIRPYQIFVARFLSVFIVAAVVIIDVNLGTSIFFPLLTSGKWQSPSFGIEYVEAHASATLCAGFFVFFAISALQGALMNILPPRLFQRISVWFQALLATAFVASIPWVFDIPNWHRTIAATPHWLPFFPPAWFLGQYETSLGENSGYMLHLREMAVIGMTVAVSLTFATYFLCYRRHTNRVLEQPSPRSSPSSLVEKLASLSKPFSSFPGQAVFLFAIRTLQRSRQHKFITGFCAAIALAFALQTVGPVAVAHFRSHGNWAIGELQSILMAPLLIGACLISALCYVFQLPSEIKAAWVFRMAEHAARRDLLDSVECLLVTCGVVPVLLVWAPLEAIALGWVIAFAHLSLVAVLLLLLIEVRLREWNKIPFTCSYVPGRRNFWQTLGIYVFLFGALIPVLTYFEAHGLRLLVLVPCAAAAGVLYFFLRSVRQTQWGVIPILFDESDEPPIVAIGLVRE